MGGWGWGVRRLHSFKGNTNLKVPYFKRNEVFLICPRYLRVLCMCSVDTCLRYVVRSGRGLKEIYAVRIYMIVLGAGQHPQVWLGGGDQHLMPLQNSHISM